MASTHPVRSFLIQATGFVSFPGLRCKRALLHATTGSPPMKMYISSPTTHGTGSPDFRSVGVDDAGPSIPYIESLVIFQLVVITTISEGIHSMAQFDGLTGGDVYSHGSFSRWIV